MNGVCIGDPECKKGKFKQAQRGKKIQGKKIVVGGVHREDGSGCNQVRVNVESDPRALAGGVEALPGRK